MNIAEAVNSDVFTWVIFPLLIFVARIFDVTLGTLRIIFISRGKKIIAPLLGFFEVLIWVVVISQIMQRLDNFICFIAYAAGFAAGNYVGIIIEEKLAIGMLVVRIILAKEEYELKNRLIDSGFGVTTVDAKGSSSDVKIIYTIIKRKDLDEVVNIINECDSNAFYSVEDARTVYHGIFPSRTGILKSGGSGLLKSNRLFGYDRKKK
jgi:uncharacterized protein YebE (UPF0316 family)